MGWFEHPLHGEPRIAYLVSGALVLATIAWLVVNRGPRYGVDFTGGTLLQIRTSEVLPADQVRLPSTRWGCAASSSSR